MLLVWFVIEKYNQWTFNETDCMYDTESWKYVVKVHRIEELVNSNKIYRGQSHSYSLQVEGN